MTAGMRREQAAALATLAHGPTLLPDGRTTFRLWAPSVSSVSLALEGRSLPMKVLERGWFELEAEAKPGQSYKFVLPDGQEVPDPASRLQRDDVHGPSVLVDHGKFEWRAKNWRNRPWHEAVIYELHPGTAGGFAAATDRLKELAAIGVTAIELMPIADFPGRRSWGYDGVLPFAPDRAYGTPDELKALVDAAHEAGLMIFLDVVYNHFGPDGAYLHLYAKEFFDEGVNTPWGAAIDFKRPEVRKFFVQNALMWVNDYRFDGLRFDAVHAISPPEFLPVLASSVRAGAERPVHLVIEHEGNRATLLGGPAAGLFDAQWSDDWHHCLHVLLTRESEGYYESFQSPAEQLAVAMRDGFVYQGQISPHHHEKRGEPSAELPPTAFVICLQNHDQIGNRAFGERLTQLAEPAALRAAAALLLLSPNIPLIFMGEEYGTRSPFLFFTDHKEDLAALVREGRRREFAHFEAFRDPAKRDTIPDPNAASTFEASVPQNNGESSETDLAFYKQALAIRRELVMPGIPGCKSAGATALNDRAIAGTWRLGNGAFLSILANFGKTPVKSEIPRGRLIFSTGKTMNGMLPPQTTCVFLADPE